MTLEIPDISHLLDPDQPDEPEEPTDPTDTEKNETPDDKDPSHSTGDHNSILAYIGVACVALGGLVVLLKKRYFVH